IGVEPVDLVGADERAAARAARQLGAVDGRRNRAVLRVRLRRGDDAAAGDGDHAVARGEVLEAAIDDALLRALHTLDHRLVLLADALDAGIRLAARLLLAVDQVVVATIALEP